MRDLSERNSNMTRTEDKLHQLHKEGKPLMEKRRRARINESLSRLKLLVLGEVKRKNTKISKLDKADILEMTVEYVNNVTENGKTRPYFDKYRAGFNTCADEVRTYLATRKEIDVELRTRVIDHLANFIQNLQWLKAAQNSNSQLSSAPANPDVNSQQKQREFPQFGNPQEIMTSYRRISFQENSPPMNTENIASSILRTSSAIQGRMYESRSSRESYVTSAPSCFGGISSPNSPVLMSTSPIFPATPPYSSSAVTKQNIPNNSRTIFVFPESQNVSKTDNASQIDYTNYSRTGFLRNNENLRDDSLCPQNTNGPMWRPW